MKQVICALCLIAIAACAGQPQQVTPQVVRGAGLENGPAAAVNAVRKEAGRAPLRRSPRLDRMARGHATDMARNQFLSHTGSDGSRLADRAARGGYEWCFIAENISNGYPGAAAAINGWQKSKGHYRNIVAPKAREFGLGQAGSYHVMVVGAQVC